MTVPGRAQSWSPDVTLLALSTASRSAVSGHSYPVPHPAPWEQYGQGRCKTTQERELSLCHEVVHVLWSGRRGMVIIPAGPSAWPLQTPVLSLSSCKQLLVAPSTSAFKHRSSSQDTSGIHRLWIYCPQFYSMALTASFISRKKKSQLFLGPCHTCFCQQTPRTFLCSFLTFQEEAEPLWVIIVHTAGKTMGWSLGNRSPAWLCLQLEYVSETAPPPRTGSQLTK